MNGRQLAQLGLGLLGVSALVNAVNIVAGVFESIAAEGASIPGAAILAVGAPTLVLLGLSYVLVFHNAPLAKVLVPDAEASVSGFMPDIARLLVALLGAMIALQTLPRCINLILNFLVAASDPTPAPTGSLIRGLVATGIELACALYLVMRPERFLAFLNRPRSEPAEVTA